MASKPRIELKIVTEDSISTAKIAAPHVTQAMYDAAYDLVYTMGTGKRRPAARKKKAPAPPRKISRGETRFSAAFAARQGVTGMTPALAATARRAYLAAKSKTRKRPGA